MTTSETIDHLTRDHWPANIFAILDGTATPEQVMACGEAISAAMDDMRAALGWIGAGWPPPHGATPTNVAALDAAARLEVARKPKG